MDEDNGGAETSSSASGTKGREDALGIGGGHIGFVARRSGGKWKAWKWGKREHTQTTKWKTKNAMKTTSAEVEEDDKQEDADGHENEDNADASDILEDANSGTTPTLEIQTTESTQTSYSPIPEVSPHRIM